MPRMRALVTVVTGTADGGHDNVAPGGEFAVETKAEAARLVEIGAAELIAEPEPDPAPEPQPAAASRPPAEPKAKPADALAGVGDAVVAGAA